MNRRHCLSLLWLATASSQARPSMQARELRFPRDFGAHPEYRVEWWYITGELRAEGGEDLYGFQVTFFRTRTGLEGQGRFAPRQLLFAHAAVTDLAGQKLVHAQRIARWSGAPAAALAAAAVEDTAVHIGDWQLRRDAGRYTTRAGDGDAGFGFELTLSPTQAMLLHGDAGFWNKALDPSQPGHYYSEPQLAVQGLLRHGSQQARVTGTAWLDHEWSETLMHPEAVGWDWIGMNLDDGAALMAFRLRRADGTPLWAGGSHRERDGRTRHFAPHEVVFEPGRRWTSPATHATYPVDWRLRTPTGLYHVRARLDAQELDSRASTGVVYWEGLSDLLDDAGRRVGRGYLEMTGYAQRLRL